ncbi:MAG: GCN5 family acetyltransferase [Geobacter sp.]|nr:MAG: GCN5 family acetyltransferase [Geobacter sp.]
MKQFVMRVIQVYEFIKHNGLSSFLHEVNYRNRTAIVVEKSLIEFDADKEQPENCPINVIELRPEFLAENKCNYTVKNRYLKATQYLKKGYGGCAIIKDEKIVGDIWFTTPNTSAENYYHPDCKWLQISCAEDQVYTFDMFLSPDERGNNFASLLQTSALKVLRQKGFTKAYGYYWSDNVPALWVHRMGKWSEVKRLKVNRFLFFKQAVA